MIRILNRTAGLAILVIVSLNIGCSHLPRQSPLLIAHRGASAYLPEHSLEAVALAHGLNADYIEQDVVLSKDGVPIVLHDVHLDTVTDVATKFSQRKRSDGRFYAIDFTLNEIKTLRLSERFDPRTRKAIYPTRFPIFQGDFNVPTLEEELQLIQGLNKSRGKQVGVYVEIKSPKFHESEGRDIIEVVLRTLSQYGYKDEHSSVFLQCFDSEALKKIKQKSSIRLIQLIGENQWNESEADDYRAMREEKGLEAVAKYAYGIGPWLNHFHDVAPDQQRRKLSSLYKLAKQKGLRVHPYTIRFDDLPKWAKSRDDLLQFLFEDVRVDGAFSDFPDIFLQ